MKISICFIIIILLVFAVFAQVEPEPEMTVERFDQLEVAQQKDFLANNLDSPNFNQFAQEYVKTAYFDNPDDIKIGDKYYSNDVSHINNDLGNFRSYLEGQGIKSYFEGDIKSFDANGNLAGTNQAINIKNFKNSPASKTYELYVDPEGKLSLSYEGGTALVSFTGLIESDSEGNFNLQEGSIINYKISNGKGLKIEQSSQGFSISSGTVTKIEGIEFNEPAEINTKKSIFGLESMDTSDLKYVTVMNNAEIKSVSADNKLGIAGSVIINDYDSIKKHLIIPRSEPLTINSIRLHSPFETTAIDFGKESLTEKVTGSDIKGFTNHVRFIDSDTIEGYGSKDFQVMFNMDNFMSTTQDYTKNNNVGLKLNSANFKISNEEGKLNFDLSNGAELKIGKNHYKVQDNQILKKPKIRDSAMGDFEIFSKDSDKSILVDDLGSVVNVVDGKSNGFMAKGTDLIQSATFGDPDAIQLRIDDILNKLELEQEISESDKNYLKSLYKVVAVGGGLKKGYNAGKAIDAYMSGKGGNIEFDSDLWTDSNVVKKEVFPEIKRDIRDKVANGEKSGTLRAFVNPKRLIGKETGNEDPELFYASHDSHITGTWKVNENGEINIKMEVNDLYDFQVYSGDQGSEAGYAYRKVTPLPIPFSDKVIDLPGSLAYQLSKICDDKGCLAKEYNMHAEWERTIKPDCTVAEYYSNTC